MRFQTFIPLEPGCLPTAVVLFNILYAPTVWSDYINGALYRFVGLILQNAEAHNVTVGEGFKYNVPSGNLTLPSVPATQNLTSIRYRPSLEQTASVTIV